MSPVGQSVSLLHLLPTSTVAVAVAVACWLVAHITEIVCVPSAKLAGALKLNGAAVSVAVCTLSTEKSTSCTPSPEVQVAITSKPACCVEPFAGDVILTVGAAAPAGPN